MQQAIIAAWYAKHANDRPRVTLPRSPYLPKYKPQEKQQ